MKKLLIAASMFLALSGVASAQTSPAQKTTTKKSTTASTSTNGGTGQTSGTTSGTGSSDVGQVKHHKGKSSTASTHGKKGAGTSKSASESKTPQ